MLPDFRIAFSYSFQFWPFLHRDPGETNKKKRSNLGPGAAVQRTAQPHAVLEPRRSPRRDSPPPASRAAHGHPSTPNKRPREQRRSAGPAPPARPCRAACRACTHRGHIGFPLAGPHGPLGAPFPLGGSLLFRAVAAKKGEA